MSWKNVQYENGKYRTSEGGGGGASNFADLDDVNFSNLQNGQVPKYNSTTQKWENANESGGGGTVTDVTVDGTSVVNQQGVAEINTPDADEIEYDNQQSGLQATDVQSAIDELAQGGGGGGVEDVEVNGTSVVNAQNVAEIKSYKEVTLAEYQALPSSKLTDNVMYCIKDVGGANQFPPLIYSFEEREVGVWTDGKPLYQKSFKFINDVTFANDKTFDTNISNMDFGFVKEATFYDYGQNRNESLPFWQTLSTGSNPSSYMQVGIQTNTKKIVLRTNSNWTANVNRFLIVTLLYTKTTDTAGSGTWTTQGGYAHHYSTSEKVIGTWIDGKPIYEKTVELASMVEIRPAGVVVSSVDVTNMDNIISCIGLYQNNKQCVPATAWVYNGSFYMSSSVSAGIDCIVIQYTKTTD